MLRKQSRTQKQGLGTRHTQLAVSYPETGPGYQTHAVGSLVPRNRAWVPDTRSWQSRTQKQGLGTRHTQLAVSYPETGPGYQTHAVGSLVPRNRAWVPDTRSWQSRTQKQGLGTRHTQLAVSYPETGPRYQTHAVGSLVPKDLINTWFLSMKYSFEPVSVLPASSFGTNTPPMIHPLHTDPCTAKGVGFEGSNRYTRVG